VKLIGPSGREYYVPVTPGIENGQHGCASTELAEARRAQRHHEVLCLVLQALVTSQPNTTAAERGVHVEIARDYANLAYPPPEKQ